MRSILCGFLAILFLLTGSAAIAATSGTYKTPQGTTNTVSISCDTAIPSCGYGWIYTGRVTASVHDAQGNPVKDVAISFNCTTRSCPMIADFKTDEEGHISLD